MYKKSLKMKNQNLNLVNYNQNDIFWKDFVNLPENPYRLDKSLDSFKCMFIFPTIKKDISKQYYPLSFGHMASLLRMNHGDAKILVQDIENYDSNEFANYDLICFYPMTALFNQTMEMSEKIKRDHPNSKICFFNSDQHQHEMLLCNPEAQNFGRKMMERYSSLDFILIGESESSFIQLCDRLNKQDSDFRDVPACLYREEEEIKVSEKPIESINFEFIPFASRDYLEKSISSGINQQSIRIQSTRGCVSPCLYCAESHSNITKGGRKKPLLIEDVSKFVDEIKLLQEKYGGVFFNIIDSSFEDPGKKGIERINEFCDQIQERNIEASFKVHLRADSIKKMSNEFLNKLKYTGIDVVICGVESPLEKELKSYRKIATLEESTEGLKRLNEIGKFFALQGYIMFSPVLELQDLPEKINFLKKIHHGWDYYNLSNNILVYPGTAYDKYLKERGLILEHDELAAIIPYHFKDERVGIVAREINKLKINYPKVISLQHSLFDSMNVFSRYHNKMNKHLHVNEKAFTRFKMNLKEILYEVEDRYHLVFSDFIDLAGSDYSEEKANLIGNKHINKYILNLSNKADNNLKSFLEGCERKNLSTDKLYLKTWMSIITSQVNASGGKIS